MDNFNQNNSYNQQVTQGNAPEYMLWLILGIVQICLICCCNIFTFICGIITVVRAVSANNYFKSGNYAMYQGKINSAKIVNIIGWVLTLVNLVFNIFVGVLDAIITMFK